MPPQCVIRRVPAAFVAIIITILWLHVVFVYRVVVFQEFYACYILVVVCLHIHSNLFHLVEWTSTDQLWLWFCVWICLIPWPSLRWVGTYGEAIQRSCPVWDATNVTWQAENNSATMGGRQAEMISCKDDIRSGHVFHFSQSINLLSLLAWIPCQHRGIQQYSASFHLRTAKLFLFFTWFFKQLSFGCLRSVPWFWRLFLGVFPHDSRAKWENRQAVLRHSSTGKSGFDQWYSELFSLMF